MKKYLKPNVEISMIAAPEIANTSGMEAWLTQEEIYSPGITTFSYDNIS